MARSASPSPRKGCEQFRRGEGLRLLVAAGGRRRGPHAVDRHADREHRLVRLAFRLQKFVLRMPRRFHRLRPHLQLALRIAAPLGFFGVCRELQHIKHLLRRGESAVQVRRADDRLDRVRKRFRVPRQFRRALVASQARRKLQPVCRLAKCRGGHHVRPPDRERTFRLVRKLREEPLRAQHPQDRIAEELQPLVVLCLWHVHPIGRRRQRLLQERLVLKRISEYLHALNYTKSDTSRSKTPADT